MRKRKIIGVLVIAFVLTLPSNKTCFAQNPKEPGRTQPNIIRQDLSPGKTSMLTPDYLFNPDPTMHVIDDRLYMFTSHDQSTVQFVKGNGWGEMYDYHAMSTTDLKTWVDHGSILSILDVSWAKENMVWDGDAGIEANGKYYAYIPFGMEIGVLVSDHPAGPYVDALGRPLVPKGSKTDLNEEVRGLLVSPTVFFYAGDPYLLFGHKNIYIVKLKPNMVELSGSIQRIRHPYDFIESPMITKIDGRYYLTYSNGGMWGETEAFPAPRIMYCIADNPFGPYGEPGILQELQINPDGQGFKHTYASSAHQGFANYKGQWYFAYHRDSKDGVHRHVCITKLDVNPDGTLGIIDPNNDPGAVEGPIDFILDAFAPYKREAEEFHERHQAQEERGIRQDYHFKMLDGSWLRYNRMDFGAGADSCRISVSCEQDDIEDAVVEFRLDAPDGELIGSVPVNATGGKTDYAQLIAKVKKVPGIHDLFIVARQQPNDPQEKLFNVNWFTFTHEACD